MLLAACGQSPAPKGSTLEIAVTGLPAGQSATANVTGPGGFDVITRIPGTLNDLPAGSYTLTPSPVTVSGTTFSALARTATVPESGTVALDYQPNSGALQITITGNVAGVPADVLVTGPEGYSNEVTATTTLEGLAPGEYQLLARRSGAGKNGRISNSSTTVQVMSDVTATSAVIYRVPTVLFFSDWVETADAIRPLLPSEGFVVTEYALANRASAEAELINGTHDLAIWVLSDKKELTPKSSVAAHLQSGGRFLYYTWHPDPDVAALLDSSFTGSTNSTEVLAADASLSAGIALPLELGDPLASIFSMDLEPSENGTSLCTYAAPSNGSCAVLGNGGRSLHLGFTPETAIASPTDGQRFWKNAIELVLK